MVFFKQLQRAIKLLMAEPTGVEVLDTDTDVADEAVAGYVPVANPMIAKGALAGKTNCGSLVATVGSPPTVLYVPDLGNV